MAAFSRARTSSVGSATTLQPARIGRDLTACAICFEEFCHPKVLPCIHTFCQECLRRHYEVYKVRNDKRLSCPSCREMIPLPPNGVAGLKNDTISIQIQELLHSLPLDNDPNDAAAAAEAEAEAALGACGGAACGPNVSTQIAELKMYENALQDALTKLRSRALHMYTYECHVRVTIATRLPARDSDPALSRLITEADCLYQKIGLVRSLRDVIEELLQKASNCQIAACHPMLDSRAREVLTRVGESPGAVRGAGAAAGVADAWLSQFQAVMFDIGAVGVSTDAGVISKKSSPMMCSPAKRKPNEEPTLLFKTGRLGSEPGNFDFPTHATFMPTGDILVCDKNNHRLQVFNELGQLKREFLTGRVKPRRARVNPRDGLLYVSDELKQAVKVFSPQGELVRSLGDRIFQCPSGIDFDSRGNVVMTDSEKYYLAILSPQGQEVLMTSFRVPGERGRQPDPCFVAVNADDQIVVSDMRNNRVKVLSNTGQVLFQIRDLWCPRGVCVDPFGNILIAEGDKHRVSMYSPHGKFVKHVLVGGQLRYPMSLDMNAAGQLLVTQCGYFSPHQVLVYQLCY